ncbi:MAG TPA: hemerythrin domain-containing protein [Labilithrix sp.]|nr:hemerythrin domain-containing protein [Labilithrix sp.]
MNAVDLLKEQHREVNQLFTRFERAKRSDEKQKIFLDLAARLVAHDAIEREIFYPACERVLGKSEPLMEGIAEHGLMEFSIFRADKARDSEPFDYLVTVLREIVQHHIEEEESEILPEAASHMGEDMLEALGKTMTKRYAASMEGDFRLPLRKNLEQVVSGRAKAAKRPARTARPGARAGARKGAVARKTTVKAVRPRAKRRTSRQAR